MKLKISSKKVSTRYTIVTQVIKVRHKKLLKSILTP